MQKLKSYLIDAKKIAKTIDKQQNYLIGAVRKIGRGAAAAVAARITIRIVAAAAEKSGRSAGECIRPWNRNWRRRTVKADAGGRVVTV